MRDLTASYLLSDHQNVPRWGSLPTRSSKASLAACVLVWFWKSSKMSQLQ